MTAGRGGWPQPAPGAAVYPLPYGGVAVPLLLPETVVRFRAMACEVTLRVVGPSAGADAALDRAREVFERVEQACTRFDPDSPLMRANAAPEEWHLSLIHISEPTRPY